MFDWGLLVSVGLAVVVTSVAWWTIGELSPPDPVARICRVLVVVVFMMWIIHVLFGHGHRINF